MIYSMNTWTMTGKKRIHRIGIVPFRSHPSLDLEELEEGSKDEALIGRKFQDKEMFIGP